MNERADRARVHDLGAQAEKVFAETNDLDALEAVRVRFLGRTLTVPHAVPGLHLPRRHLPRVP